MSSLPELYVAGTGAVSPAGLGTATLMNPPPAELLQEALLSHPEKNVELRRVDLKNEAFLRWQQEARLRRASPLALFLMEAASQALEKNKDLDRSRLGLVCALGTGSIAYSRRFFADTLKRGRRFASPALFPETVYNSPVSHVASMLGVRDACYSLMGDESSWVEGLRVAQVWLACGKVDSVLVLGGEELDMITVEAMYRAGWLKRGVIPSEGAGAVLVTARATEGPSVRLQPDSRTISYRTVLSQKNAWESLLAGKENCFLPGNVVPSRLAEKWRSLPLSGPDWGAAFTASAAWASLQMIESGKSGYLLVPGCNCGVSRVEIGSLDV